MTKRTKKLKRHSSTSGLRKVDPDGFVCSEHGRRRQNRSSSLFIIGNPTEQQQQQQHGVDPHEEEKAPFLDNLPLSTNPRQNKGVDDERQQLKEEAELFTDTFSFLMCARYPCEKLTKQQQEAKKNYNKKQAVAAEQTPTREVETDEDGDDDDDAEKEEEILMGRNQRKLQNVDADLMCFPFITGLFVLNLQIFIYVVVFLASIQDGTPPPSDTLLRLAQCFALIVALYTQSDLVDAIFMLTEGSERLASITTPFKFTVSNAARFLAGNLGIIASFALVIYADDVIDLLLNFTAIEFVATLDDSAFHLAAKGFLGITLKKKAIEIADFRYEYVIRKRFIYTRLVAYIAYFVAYSGSLLVIIVLQNRRVIGVSNEIYVQFDDTNVPDLFGISGAYIGCAGAFATKRGGRMYTRGVGYVEASYHGNCPELDEGVFPANSFYYCVDDESWVFIKQATADPCEDHVVRSFVENGEGKPSDAYDILAHANARWLIHQPDTGGEAFLDDIFMMGVDAFGISYNCTNGLQFVAEVNGFDIEGTTFRTSVFPLSGSFHPIFDDDSNFFERFSLVYRQVFLGTPDIVNAEFDIAFESFDISKIDELNRLDQSGLPNCDNQSPDDDPSKFSVTFFDGLRWHYFYYLDLQMFADYAKRKYKDAGEEQCASKLFMKYFLRDKTWMLNETIAIPGSISDPMNFVSSDDTGVPTRNLNWYETDVVYSGALLRPGRSRNEAGLTLSRIEGSCLISQAECSKDEIRFNLDLTTGQFPRETVVLVKLNPSFQNTSVGLEQSLTDYSSRLEELGNPYENTTIVPITETSTLFSISEQDAKDFRFRDRQTRYQLEACVPFEAGSSFCLGVKLLNTAHDGLPEFFLGFGERVERNSGDMVRCRDYSLCYFQAHVNANSTSTVFTRWIFPNDCSFSDVEALYPGINTPISFEKAP